MCGAFYGWPGKAVDAPVTFLAPQLACSMKCGCYAHTPRNDGQVLCCSIHLPQCVQLAHTYTRTRSYTHTSTHTHSHTLHPPGRPQVAGLVIAPVAMLLMAYALWMYRKRTAQILRRETVRWGSPPRALARCCAYIPLCCSACGVLHRACGRRCISSAAAAVPVPAASCEQALLQRLL